MRVGLLILLGLIVAGAGMSYVLYGELHSETVVIEAAAQPVVGADGASCKTVVFDLGSRRRGKLYIRADEGQSIDGRFVIRGPSERDIILQVYSPHNRIVLPGSRRHELDFTIPAVLWGDYLFEFDNRFSILTDKTIELTYCLR